MQLSEITKKFTEFGQHRIRVMGQKKRNRKTVMGLKQPFFAKEIGWLLEMPNEWLRETFAEYQACSAAWELLSGLQSPSSETDGFAKSLDIAEGFAVWSLVKAVRPHVIVELGVQYGISSRLWKEALKRYVPEHQLILCDLEDKRRFVDDSESTFVKGDAYKTLPKIFASQPVDILHNDAHPYSLIDWSVREGLRQNVRIFTFHDVNSISPRNPFKLHGLELSGDEKRQNDVNWGEYGHWERHVMGEQFDERIWHETAVESQQYKMQIFESLFGFGVAINKGV